MSVYKIIIPHGLKPRPSKKELSAAKLLAQYFQADIEFVPRSNIKTPDFKIGGTGWELKSPTTAGKYTAQHSLTRGSSQSVNMIIDLRGVGRLEQKLFRDVVSNFNMSKLPKRLVIVDGQSSVFEVNKKRLRNKSR